MNIFILKGGVGDIIGVQKCLFLVYCIIFIYRCSVGTMEESTGRSDLSEAVTLEDMERDVISTGSWTPVGRIPTPKMSQDGLRHHLDRTTPLHGGALLSSPPRDQVAAAGRKRSSSQGSETLTESSELRF